MTIEMAIWRMTDAGPVPLRFSSLDLASSSTPHSCGMATPRSPPTRRTLPTWRSSSSFSARLERQLSGCGPHAPNRLRPPQRSPSQRQQRARGYRVVATPPIRMFASRLRRRTLTAEASGIVGSVSEIPTPTAWMEMMMASAARAANGWEAEGHSLRAPPATRRPTPVRAHAH